MEKVQNEITCQSAAYGAVRAYLYHHKIDLDIDNLKHQLLTGQYDADLKEQVDKGRRFVSKVCGDEAVVDYYFKHLSVFARALPEIITNVHMYDEKFLGAKAYNHNIVLHENCKTSYRAEYYRQYYAKLKADPVRLEAKRARERAYWRMKHPK